VLIYILGKNGKMKKLKKKQRGRSQEDLELLAHQTEMALRESNTDEQGEVPIS
jgi:hypothetical protein